jgi:hypothetical protein
LRHPLDEVHYLECKIILKPDRFTSVQSFLDFAKLVRRVADESDVRLSTGHLAGQRPQIREVIFLDTAHFKLYNNAFILWRRIKDASSQAERISSSSPPAAVCAARRIGITLSYLHIRGLIADSD